MELKKNEASSSKISARANANTSNSPTRPVIDVLDHQLEQLADELQRRRTASNSPATNRHKAPKVLPKPKPAIKTKANNDEPMATVEATSDMDDFDEATRMLNTWLGELDNLQKGLDTSFTGKMSPSPLGGQTSSYTLGRRPATASPASTNGLMISSSTASRESSATPVHLRRLSTPRLDSPRLDSYRYSLINLEESLEHDLDAILGELCVLESHFNQDLKPSPDRQTDVDAPSDLPPPPAPLQLEELLASEPQYISAESVRHNKVLSKRTESPDTDSAFCENTSSNSSGSNSGNNVNSVIIINNNNNNNCVSATSTLKSSIKPVVKQPALSPDEVAAKAKAEKIRLAIEKIKEASIKKIFIKVFGEDGSTKSLLVDERMSVAQVCRLLAEKNYVKRDTSWGLVELLPDLHMERAYEDHEGLVENLLMWKADSKNTLWFIKRPEVYDLFNRPEMYLLGSTSSQIGSEMEDRARAELLEEYFSSSGVGAPEVEGHLWLKAEGKKSWKKFYFVLRTSGLYYAPKGKKTSKDLVCLARFDVNQIYFGVKWQPKFKAPTRHCFAIKHPQIQAKNPKYIRYLCADNEVDLNKWVTGIRLAKHGRQLYENFRGIIEEMAHDDIDRLASARNSVNTPAVSMHDTVNSCDHSLVNAHSSSGFSTPVPSEKGSFSHSPMTTTVIVHSSQSGGVQCTSSRSSSVSLGEKSTSSQLEQGFSCDSPEGGTIKKKPASAKKNSLATFKPATEGTPKASKEVRFMDTYSMIPDPDDSDNIPAPAHRTQTYATMRRGTPTSNEPLTSLLASESGSVHEQSVYKNIESILNSHRRALSPEPMPLKRRHSNESLVSNPQMLHTATLVSPQPQPQPPQQPQLVLTKVQLSPQPQRPAPVLKPQISRKPSLDKTMIMKKQNDSPVADQARPTYEDTLKKCQSLTNQKPEVPPKPEMSPKVAPKPTGLALAPKVKHLPPSGLTHRTPTRSSSLNRPPGSAAAPQTDLEQSSESDSRPFPNRFSTGEYENANVETSNDNNAKKTPAPPLPKRNDETHLSWNRS